MALLLRDLSLDISIDESIVSLEAARQLGVDARLLTGFRIIRRSIDARKKNQIRKVYTIEFCFSDEAALLEKHGNARLERVA